MQLFRNVAGMKRSLEETFWLRTQTGQDETLYARIVVYIAAEF